MKYLMIFLFLSISIALVSGQGTVVKPIKDSLYQSNIKKSNLYGVYIPRDIDDALEVLMELTTEQARNPMIKVHEDTIARKLHFGIGRWMEYNWNFVDGSRFSHLLREKGIMYSDDMVRFMIVTFHRHLSKKPLNSDELAKRIIDDRNEIIKKRQAKMPVLSETTKIIEKKQ